MITYLSIYLSLAFLGLINATQRQKRIIFVFLYFFLVLFVGTRFETGCDFQTYANRFRLLPSGQDALSFSAEPGYFLFTFLVKKSGLDFIWINIFGAAIFFTIF
ncbi:MAG: EpsG family protein [Halioglobus sp.]|nr:EpsG family protein [Halioglobus sp.]